MIPIKVRYPQLIGKAELNTRFPERAEECTLEQIMLLAKIMLEGSDYPQQVHAAIVLSGIPKALFLRLEPETQNRLRELAEWVFRKGLAHDNVLLPSVKVKGEIFISPEERLLNSSFLEFVYADQYATDYVAGDEKALDLLIATLYRPPKTKAQLLAEDYNGDPRRKMTRHGVTESAKVLANMPLPMKLVIFSFFAGCKAFICQQFPDIFGEAGEQPAQPTENPYAVMQRELAKQGSLGDLDKVQYENLYNVLEFWQDLVRPIQPQPVHTDE